MGNPTELSAKKKKTVRFSRVLSPPVGQSSDESCNPLQSIGQTSSDESDSTDTDFQPLELQIDSLISTELSENSSNHPSISTSLAASAELIRSALLVKNSFDMLDLSEQFEKPYGHFERAPTQQAYQPSGNQFATHYLPTYQTYDQQTTQQTSQQLPDPSRTVQIAAIAALYSPKIASFPNPIISSCPRSIQRRTFPPLNPSAQPLSKRVNPWNPTDPPSPDPQHQALDLLMGTPTNPVQVNLALYSPSIYHTQNEIELVLLRNSYLSFMNKWKQSNLLVDYHTIRLACWHERWPVIRRMALTERERLSLKKIKICGPLPRVLMTNFLDNIGLLPSVDQLEIDELELSLTSAPMRTFNSLKLFSVDSIRVVDLAGNVMPPQRFLTINAPNLWCVNLGKWVSFYRLLFDLLLILSSFDCYCK